LKIDGGGRGTGDGGPEMIVNCLSYSFFVLGTNISPARDTCLATPESASPAPWLPKRLFTNRLSAYSFFVIRFNFHRGTNDGGWTMDHRPWPALFWCDNRV